MARFKFLEKINHWKAVAKGEKATKASAKYSDEEQKAYARGRVEQFNESKRAYAYKNATPEQRAAYKAEQSRKRAEYKNSASGVGSVVPISATKGGKKK